MSTRSSIYYGNGIHVYRECLSDDICLECETTFSEDFKLQEPQRNKKYDSFTMPLSEWKELAEGILKEVAYIEELEIQNQNDI